MTQTVRATLGDNPGAGEVAYVGDPSNLQIDFDPTYLYNIVNVTNNGIATGWAPARNSTVVSVGNTASIARYGQRTLGKTVSLTNDSDTTAAANYYLNQYSTPRKRVSSILIDAAKSATAFSFCLGVEVGDLINFNRRPIGAPMISIPCVVLDIKHDVAPDKWQTTLILAPAPV